ncbi:MAG: GatB/YqeY domain-containing protein [Stagnimonas sp.]|nr:GatB/YqeY domain-containing protein [Stagnimonas sp.]
MTDLKTRITEDVKIAMKAGEKERVSLLRMLTAELKQREVVEQIELTDAAVIAAIEKMLKQRKDSESQFRAANRAELADKEAAEIAGLMVYLPAQLSDAELDTILAEVIAETGAAGPKDMGKVMAAIKPKVTGKTDMGALSAKIKAKLA